MGIQSILDAQSSTYWKLLKLNQRLRRTLDQLGTDSFPSQPNDSARQAKQKADRMFRAYRALTKEFRELSYSLRGSGDQDCPAFLKHSIYGDPSEVFPSWSSVYRGSNYSFKGLRSDGRRIFPEEQGAFSGFWQLFRNLLPAGDTHLELWPDYFGQSSSGGWRLESQKDILDELRFPISAAKLDGAIAVDIETSSLTPLTGEILEIGIVELLGPDPREWPRFSMRFDLSSPLARSLGTGAEHIHGIAPADLRGSPRITDSSVQRMLQSYLCSGKRLISHNASFEFRWLSQYVDGFFEANYNSQGLQSFIDTAVLSKFAFSMEGGSGIEGNSLEAVVGALGLSYESAHRAQADAAMAALAAQGMLNRINRKSIPELSSDDYRSILLEPLST